MKLRIFMALSAIFLVSCSSKPLTQAECQQIGEKEIQFALAHFPPQDAASQRKYLESRMADANTRCMAGKGYNRSEYQCMVNAKTTEEIGKCIAEVNKRLGQ